MKKVGIIGGLGPASTLDYYSGIIDGYRAIKQDDQYPEIVIDSINMTEMMGYLEKQDFENLVLLLLHSVEHLKAAGADFAAIASNTPHIVFSELKKRSPLPLISIVEATCAYAKENGCKNVIVLGTKFTMTNGLYTNVFPKYGVNAVVPDEVGVKKVHGIIFPKLEQGIVDPEDKKKLLTLADAMIKENKADGLVLGCTELPIMVKEGDLNIKILNTTQIHIDAIIKECL